MPHRESSDDARRPARVLDRNHLARATGDNASLMEDLLDMLRRELPARKRQLDAALESGDHEAAVQVAHKLQGAATYTGALELERAAAEFEDTSERDDRDFRGRARMNLEEAIAALQRALDSEDPFSP